LAACHFVLVAYTIAINIKQTGSIAIESNGRKGARAVIICSQGIEITSDFHLTARYFILVAHSVIVTVAIDHNARSIDRSGTAVAASSVHT
jgi:hypothetical protein